MARTSYRHSRIPDFLTQFFSVYSPMKLHIIKSVYFVFSFVGPLMQSLRQRAARKAFLQSIMLLHNFGRFTCKVLASNVMCRRQLLFSYVHMFNTSTSYHSKQRMHVSSASAVHKSLTEAMSHLLQIATYLISEESNRYKGRQSQ